MRAQVRAWWHRQTARLSSPPLPPTAQQQAVERWQMELAAALEALEAEAALHQRRPRVPRGPRVPGGPGGPSEPSAPRTESD